MESRDTAADAADDGVRVGGIGRDAGEGSGEMFSEQRRLALEHAGIGTWKFDFKTGALHWDEGQERLFGLQAGEFTGSLESVYSFLHPDDVDAAEGRMAFASRVISGFQDELRIVWRNGSTHWIASRGELVKDAFGNPEHLVGVSWDTTDRKAAEIEVVRLAAIIECSEDAIFSQTFDGIVTTWNAGATKLFGFEPEEIRGGSVTRLLPREAEAEAANVIDRLRRGQRIESMDTIRLNSAGARIDVSLSISPIRDNLGNLIGVSTIARDISDERSYARERRYVMAGARCMLWYADIHETGSDNLRWEVRIPDLEAAQRFLPLDLSNGVKYPDAWYQARIPGDREDSDMYGNACVRDGRSYEQEFRCRALDGSLRWMHEDIRVDIVVPNAQWRAIAVCTDVTDRRISELALRESEVRLKSALHAGNMGIWDWDLLSNVLTWSEETERLFGIPTGSFDGRVNTYRKFLPLEERDVIDGAIAKAVRERTTFEHEHRVLLRDGSMRWVIGRGAAIYDKNGEPTRVTGTVADITDRKRLEQQLLQAQKMEGIGRLAGGIAHDFNNLLTVVLGYAEIMEAEMPPDSPLTPSLLSIQFAAERAARLTSQLLAFARSQPALTTVISLNDLITGMGRILKPLIRENISLSMTLPDDVGSVRVDGNQIEQVIINLVVNAVDAMPNGGRLLIESRVVRLSESDLGVGAITAPGDYVMIAVSDTGVGMSDATKSRLFEPFFTTKEVGKGTGLGLATVYGIVKRSGGFVSPYSEPGAGTTMKVYLPRVDDGEGEVARQDVDDSVDADLLDLRGDETVLVVEDQELVRNLTVTILERHGYRVLQACNGVEALRTSEEHDGAIDLLLTDAIMPEMGGRELIEQLASRWPTIRVMVLSGYTEELSTLQGMLPEGISYLQKPFNAPTLLSEVRAAMHRTDCTSRGLH